MIRINLLPVKAAQKKEMLLGQLIILAAAAILVVAACGGVYASLMFKIGDQKKAIKSKEDEIEQLKKAIGEVGKFQKLQKELQGKLDVLDQLKSGKSGPVHLLDELSAAIPETVWITSFKESKGAFEIAGAGANEKIVAEFMENLERSPYFQKVELKVVEQTPQFGGKIHKFSILCQIETPPKTPSP